MKINKHDFFSFFAKWRHVLEKRSFWLNTTSDENGFLYENVSTEKVIVSGFF
jgi:hypothetical protein